MVLNIKTLALIAICAIVLSDGKSLSRNKRGLAMQDLHNRKMSRKMHNDRVRVLKGKVDELNSGKWEYKVDDENDEPKLRKRETIHHQLERDGNGGFRRVQDPIPSESEELTFEIEITEHEPSLKQNKISKKRRREQLKSCLDLIEIVKKFGFSVEVKCDF